MSYCEVIAKGKRNTQDQYLFICVHCFAKYWLPKDTDPDFVVAKCQKDRPRNTTNQLPGTELYKLFLQLKVLAKVECNCKRLLRDMNDWGPEGCEQRRDRIIERLKENAESYDWSDYAMAAKASVFVLSVSELIQINPVDPLPGCLNIAIERSRKSECIIRQDQK